MRHTDEQRAEIDAYICAHYADQPYTHFMARFGISKATFERHVSRLIQSGEITPKAQRRIIDNDQKRALCVALWNAARDPSTTDTDVALQFGFETASNARQVAARYLYRFEELNLAEFIARPAPRFGMEIGLAALAADRSRAARLACIPWTPAATQAAQLFQRAG